MDLGPSALHLASLRPLAYLSILQQSLRALAISPVLVRSPRGWILVEIVEAASTLAQRRDISNMTLIPKQQPAVRAPACRTDFSSPHSHPHHCSWQAYWVPTMPSLSKSGRPSSRLSVTYGSFPERIDPQQPPSKKLPFHTIMNQPFNHTVVKSTLCGTIWHVNG